MHQLVAQGIEAHKHLVEHALGVLLRQGTVDALACFFKRLAPVLRNAAVADDLFTLFYFNKKTSSEFFKIHEIHIPNTIKNAKSATNTSRSAYHNRTGVGCFFCGSCMGCSGTTVEGTRDGGGVAID